jgi:hypothetical protein
MLKMKIYDFAKNGLYCKNGEYFRVNRWNDEGIMGQRLCS